MYFSWVIIHPYLYSEIYFSLTDFLSSQISYALWKKGKVISWQNFLTNNNWYAVDTECIWKIIILVYMSVECVEPVNYYEMLTHHINIIINTGREGTDLARSVRAFLWEQILILLGSVASWNLFINFLIFYSFCHIFKYGQFFLAQHFLLITFLILYNKVCPLKTLFFLILFL